MDDEPTGSIDTEVSVSVGGSQTGEIEVEGDIDFIAVELIAGVTYQIDLEGSETGSGTLLDPFLTGIFNSNSVSVAGADDDAGVVTNSRITFTPTVSGTYYIGASHFDNTSLTDVGTYTLYVEVQSLSTRPDPNPLDSVATTGNGFIDGLTANFGYGADSDGIARVTYSFPQADAVFGVPFNLDEEGPDLTLSNIPASASAVSFFEAGLAHVSELANIEFTLVSDNSNGSGTIRLSGNTADSGNVLGIAAFPNEGLSGGDIFLFESSIRIAALSFVTLHELGHALGLSHPTDEFPDAFIGVEFTLLTPSFMSAFFPEANRVDFYPTSFSYGDILALRQIYGDALANDGNNVYTFDLGSKYFETLFDLGGTDTIKIVGTGGNVSIDLTPNSDYMGGSFINVGTTVTYFNGGIALGARSDTVFVSPETVIENVIAAGGNDLVVGNSANNRLEGGAGNDSLTGSDGTDTLRGDEGNDRLVGGTDNDFISGGAGNDTVSGGSGNDQIFAGPDDAGNDILVGDAGDDVLGGGAGNDFIIGGGQSGTVAGLSNTGSASNDDGQDTLYGGAGNDTLIGGGFDDADGDGVFDTGEAVQTGTASNIAFAGTGNDLIYGAAGADTLGGGTGNDTLNGGDGNDTLYGGGGDTEVVGLNDVIDGGDGNDLITASGGNDSIDGGSGNDTIFGGTGNDTITGGSGADEIFNSAGDDNVDGGSGEDTLRGNAGDDTLTGGSEADFFTFRAGDGDDIVTDFDLGEDSLSLANTNTDFTNIASVEAASTNVVLNGQSGVLIDTGGGDSIFLIGVSVATLNAAEILFA